MSDERQGFDWYLRCDGEYELRANDSAIPELMEMLNVRLGRLKESKR